jgi:hypothetical protein
MLFFFNGRPPAFKGASADLDVGEIPTHWFVDVRNYSSVIKELCFGGF